MNIINLIKVSITAVAANKMRSFLSTLGIIIGVGAVIAMMSIGQGAKQNIRAELSTMGSNLLTIRPGADNGPGGVRKDPSAMQTLKLSDYQSLSQAREFVKYVSPEVMASGQVVYGNKNATTTVYGESEEYPDMKQWKVEQGVAFTQDDVRRSAKVCLVGKTVVDNLFGEGADPVGKVIRFKSIPLSIVGVLKSKGYNSWGMDQDDVIVAPFTCVMKRIAAQNYFSSINCSAVSEELSDAAMKEIQHKLRENHKIKDASGDSDDFSVRSMAEMMEAIGSTMDMVTLILGIAAGFSLLIAGIGIMNIMLVSVTERTKEIGLRMAVGATGFVISVQFLIEAIVISVTGGIFGVLLGLAASNTIMPLVGLPSVVPTWAIVLSFCICVAIGCIFGYLPARKAANMDPIEAIRHE